MTLEVVQGLSLVREIRVFVDQVGISSGFFGFFDFQLWFQGMGRVSEVRWRHDAAVALIF